MSGTITINANDLLNAVKPQLLQIPEITQQPYSYIIWTDGTNYYAKNGATGQIVFSGTNASTVIESTIHAGAKYIFIKSGITWIPTDNFIPSNLIIVGEDAESVIIKAKNPDTDYITVGSNTMLVNVAIHDRYGIDIGLNPNIPRPVRFYYNARDTATIPSFWYRQFAVIDAGEPDRPVGDPQHDTPMIAVNQWSIGDAIYVGTLGDGVGVRIHVNEINNTRSGSGIVVQHFGQGAGVVINIKPGAGGFGLVINPESPDVFPIYISDVTTSLNKPDIAITCTKRTSGNMINLFHAESNYNDDALLMNLGNLGGNFTGRFINLLKAGTRKFSIDHEGYIYVGGIENSPGLQKGVNIPIPTGSSYIDITLPVPEPDTNYGVIVTPQWNTTVWISNKTTTGFRVNFSIAPSQASYIDWLVFR
jgi:hypothetical protein